MKKVLIKVSWFVYIIIFIYLLWYYHATLVYGTESNLRESDLQPFYSPLFLEYYIWIKFHISASTFIFTFIYPMFVLLYNIIYTGILKLTNEIYVHKKQKKLKTLRIHRIIIVLIYLLMFLFIIFIFCILEFGNHTSWLL
jgi:hypothetical protein